MFNFFASLKIKNTSNCWDVFVIFQRRSRGANETNFTPISSLCKWPVATNETYHLAQRTSHEPLVWEITKFVSYLGLPCNLYMLKIVFKLVLLTDVSKTLQATIFAKSEQHLSNHIRFLQLKVEFAPHLPNFIRIFQIRVEFAQHLTAFNPISYVRPHDIAVY